MTVVMSRPAVLAGVLAFVLGLVLVWFAPVLLAGRIFLSDNTMPAFFMPVSFWSDLLYSGFPLLADLTFANGYPVRILISQFTSLIGPAVAYNSYVCSAYVIAALGAYAYAWEVTRDNIAALTTACAFAFCSFLQAHLGHETITHTAAWMPAVVWATHRCVVRGTRPDIAWLALFVAMVYLGSHPQITLQIGIVSVVYAVFLAARADRPMIALTRFVIAWVLGMALVAWQMGPAVEYGAGSIRDTPPVKPTFVGALPLAQLPQVVMPWIFGSYPPTAVAPVAHFGDPLSGELVAYIPPAVLMLAGIAALAAGAGRVSRFWSVLGLVFFVLVLGPQTFLGQLRFFTPVFNLFNMPARDMLTVNFAAAALAGIGMAAMRRESIRATVVAGITLGAVPTLAALFFYPVVERKAAEAGIALSSAWQNVAILVPLGLTIVSAGVVWAAGRTRNSAASLAVLLSVIVGCGYYGWFAPWRTMSGPSAGALDKPEAVSLLEGMRSGREGRVLVADGWIGPAGVIPNTSMLFGLENVAGYGPLLSRPYAELTGLTNAGWIRPDRFEPQNRILDLLNVRWIFPSKPEPEKFVEIHGIRWSAAPLARSLGGTCGGGSPIPAVDFDLPQPVLVSKVAIVTTLGCAADVPQGMEVARLILEDGRGNAKTMPLLAGVHTSEWSVECGKTSSGSGHRAARVFDSAAASGCMAHHYLAEFATEGASGRRVRIEWSPAMKRYPRVYMKVQHLTLYDAMGKAMPVSVNPGPFADNARWRPHVSAQGTTLMENLRAMPRAWLVHHVEVLKSMQDEASVIHGGKLRDGRAFLPAEVAITSDSRVTVPQLSRDSVPTATKPVEVLLWEPNTRVLSVDVPAPAMMVISSRYHPGWSATVGDAEAAVVRLNGVLQGVALPEGRYEVKLSFRPTNFFALLAVSLFALLVVVGLFGWRKWTRGARAVGLGTSA